MTDTPFQFSQEQISDLAARIEAVIRHCYPIDARGDVPEEVKQVQVFYEALSHKMGFSEARSEAIRDVLEMMIVKWIVECHS